MYLLSETPILLDFLYRLFRHNRRKYSKKQLIQDFYLAEKCNCNQADCATVFLKKRRHSKYIENIDFTDEHKGYIHDNHLEDDYIEIECIVYRFPFKSELNKLFPKNNYISKHKPRLKYKNKHIAKRDKKKLEQYFRSGSSIYERKILGELDYKAYRDYRRLFQHVRNR